MTYSAALSGHHATDDWRDDEYEMLRSLVELATAAEAGTVTGFSFNGNHVSANTIQEATEKLEAYDAEGEEGTSDAPEERVEPEGS